MTDRVVLFVESWHLRSTKGIADYTGGGGAWSKQYEMGAQPGPGAQSTGVSDNTRYLWESRY